ncbi:hypothetical protein [Sphingosinicella sp.]|uniref:hypothetical protein n=1 Tax=Sphingosinicella sp. TaxID=1917971 RepID=UPI004037F205
MVESGFQGWRVPPLGGWALRVYAVLWWLLLAAALATTVLIALASAWDGPERIPLLRAGINYTRDGTPGLVVFDVSSLQARRAGVDGGDRIVAINDSATVDEGLDAVVDGADGDVMVLRLAEPGGQLRDVPVTLGPAHVEEALRSAGFSASFMAGWTFAILVLGNLLGILASILLFRGDRSNPVAALLALIPLATAVGGYGELPVAASVAILSVTALLLPMALLAFPDGRFATRTSIVLLGLNLLWALAYFWDPYLYGQGVLVLLAASALATIPRLRRTAATDQRQQLRWAMLGFAGSAVCALGLLACSQLQYARDDLWYVIVNDMASDLFDLGYTICLWGGLIVALLRYRLYDADAAITRSAVWAIAAPLLAFFFTATIEVLKVALGPVLGNDMVVVPSAGALTAMLIAPVGSWIERRVELWSRRDLIALSRELPAAASDLSENDDAGLLLGHACRAVGLTMKARATAIAVRGEAGWAAGALFGVGAGEVGSWLAAAALPQQPDAVVVARDDPLFPVRVALIARPAGEPEAIAWLLVGPRPDGSIQDRDARAVLAEIAPSLGRALHVIAARQRRFATLLENMASGPTPEPAVPPAPKRLKKART